MITADETMSIETISVIISNWLENSGTMGDVETVGVELDEGDSVEFANGVANGTMLSKSIDVWTDGVHSDGSLGLALAVLPT
jgi:hypothetical protein